MNDQRIKAKFKGFPHCDVYRCDGLAPWPAGEIRDVAKDFLDSLVDAFGDAFEAIEPPKGKAKGEAKAAAPKKPKRSAAMKSPKRK